MRPALSANLSSRHHSGTPIAEQIRVLGPHAAGVVVGSALIDAMAQADPIIAVTGLVSELREAAAEIEREETDG